MKFWLVCANCKWIFYVFSVHQTFFVLSLSESRMWNPWIKEATLGKYNLLNFLLLWAIKILDGTPLLCRGNSLGSCFSSLLIWSFSSPVFYKMAPFSVKFFAIILEFSGPIFMAKNPYNFPRKTKGIFCNLFFAKKCFSSWPFPTRQISI